jgi:uncharacterized repeat protein (TIGR01451 family)
MKTIRALLCSTVICVVLSGIALAKPAVKLHFSGVLVQNVNGKVQTKPVQGLTLHAGDVVRYTIDAKNDGDEAAFGFTAVGPVPAHTQYVSGSARGAQPAQIQYSLDGKAWASQPAVRVKTDRGMREKPAPASAYVSVRFTSLKPLQPKASAQYSYEVVVK